MTLVETGRRALARGEWKNAKRAFESALRQKEAPAFKYVNPSDDPRNKK